jgi:nitrogenase iron protein NifH
LSNRIQLKKERPKIVAIYGKAGIGKSTISSNVSAALSQMGLRVAQIGCDPKRDSVALLCHRIVPTVLEQLRAEQEEGEVTLTEEALSKVIFKGYNDILCIESGGPRPGIGCGGRGVLLALDILSKFEVLKKYNIDIAILDVLGDVVCGGFSQPMRAGYAREIYIVVCGEPLTLYITNNILRAVKRVRREGAPCGVAGLINNQRGVPYEREIVERFAEAVKVPVIEHVPRSPLIQEGEAKGMTVIEAFPDSEMAKVFRELAMKIKDNEYVYDPSPLPRGLEDVIDMVRDLLR